jgi:hypothetical protein
MQLIIQNPAVMPLPLFVIRMPQKGSADNSSKAARI